jgi:hypothetical protein
MHTDHDALGLAALVLSTLAALLLVPDLSVALLGHPAFGAVIGAAAMLTLIVVLRGRGRRGSALERFAFAAFLALMPTVYVMSRLRFGGSANWLGLELLGQGLFAALALVGARRSPWILAAGIAGHGLLWDSWHHGRTPFMPDWYAIACLIVDVGWGLYVATQVRAWRS